LKLYLLYSHAPGPSWNYESEHVANLSPKGEALLLEGTRGWSDYNRFKVNLIFLCLFLKKTQKSRNSCKVRGGGVGAEGVVTMGENPCGSGTNTKRSKIAFSVTCIAISLGHCDLGPRMLGLPPPM